MNDSLLADIADVTAHGASATPNVAGVIAAAAQGEKP